MDLSNWINTEDIICHYTSLDSAASIIESGEFRFSNVAKSIDLSEKALYQFNFGETSHSRDNVLTRHEHPELLDSIRRELICYTKNAQIACFCQNQYYNLGDKDHPFNEIRKKCYMNPRMWEQYGDKYFGACLLFSKKQLEEALRKSKAVFSHGVVKYEDDLRSRFRLLQIDLDLFFDIKDDNQYIDIYKKNYDKTLLMKDSDYISEKEYRIIVHEDNPFSLNITNAIKGIAFFYCYSKEQVRNLAKEGIRLLGLVFSDKNVDTQAVSIEKLLNKKHLKLYNTATDHNLPIIRLDSNETGLTECLPDRWEEIRKISSNNRI